MLKTILVALDGTELSEQVIHSLDEINLQPETKVILSHVIPPPGEDVEWSADRPHGISEEIPYRKAEKQLQTYQNRLPYQSELEIVTGDPAEEIVRLANIHHADLIIIGSRGLTGVKRILERSVSSQVIEDAPCSVLLIKPR
ncbi:universal stress protein [Phormidium sp. LEGE 05292]|uniref:universal stress protein n=1 Tax=[Phormidium] sp. LEGE 05292 TaxID=767427 RepID=UPI00187E2547|nr:universal stress protein [Phormidium sp. LEGE 05292]MBE9226096.1 universal stress protein [Phormidium sp. LEGE 05292]